jgi:hypothetical protein
MDATTAVPGLRTVSVPASQARVLNLAQSMATDSYAFVGSAEAEMKMTDSITGEARAKPSISVPAAWGSRVRLHVRSDSFCFHVHFLSRTGAPN